MKPRTTLLALWAASQLAAQAQVGIGTTTPDASAQLDITSTTLGFFLSSSFASLRLCARHSSLPGPLRQPLTPLPIPFIPIKSYLAQRRKDAKFFRI
jgi:hypothetical protein